MDINYEDVFPNNNREIGQMDVSVEEEELIRESIRRIILEADDFQCNSHSLGFIDDQGNWLDTEGADHSDYLWANVYGMEDNRPGGYPMPAGWIKVSNASQIFFGGNSWDDVTPQQINGLIEMWGACSKYSRWIQKETETFKVIFGLIGQNRRMSNLEEMTIPDFLGLYGGRRAIENFYGMLLGENKRSTKRIILEVSEFGCNKHSLGWIDPNGNFYDITEYSETHDEWMDRYQELNGSGPWIPHTNPPGWIKVSNTSEFWFEGNDWSEITQKQVDGMIKVWIECGKRHSRWIRKDAETRLINFMSPGGLDELTIGEFLATYGTRKQQDNFFGWLLGK